VSGQKSSLRLIAAGGPPHDFYRAGVEIRLDPGALTYWRMPGGAGAPPVFSFEGSANTASVTVSYPVPMRFDEDGTEAFGYRDRVIFPLRVIPKDETRPVLLSVNLSYAVCDRICLPAKARTTLALDPNQGEGVASPEATAIAAAEAEVPVPLTPQQRSAKVTIVRDKTGSSPTWRLSTKSNAQDLFAEAPPGWYFETRKTRRPAEFLIVAVEQPQADGRPRSKAPIPVTLTLKGKRQSYEFTVDLNAASNPSR
jgi:DsbC/DsbD-like thiol-disulfide interchange protein